MNAGSDLVNGIWGSVKQHCEASLWENLHET